VSADAWRGVAAERAEEVSAGLAALLRERSRRLLGGLLRPHRRAVAATVALVVVASLAALAGPWLVGIAIDAGLPPLLHGGDAAPLLGIAAAFAAAVAVQAVATRMFVTMTGRVGQRVVLELRRRLFAHCLSLDVAFHEDYTSGRVISRQTSDIEAISDLFEEGLDSLISALLTLLLVGTGMLLLEWRLGLVVLAGFIPLTWLTAWFRRESARAYRRTREAIALVIVHFVETFGGIPAVQAFRREDRNSAIFSRLGADYRDASRHASRLIAVYGPSISLVGNVMTGVILAYGGLLVIDGDMKVGVLASFLLYLQRFFDPLQDVSQFYNIFQAAASGLEKISGLLEQEPAVPEPRAPAALPPRRGGRGGPSPRAGPGAAAPSGRRVRFESVTFGRADRRPRRRDRGGQDDDRAAARPVLRPALGPRHAGRDRPEAAARRGAPRRGDRDHPGELPVQRHRRGQHQARPPRRVGRRRRGGGPDDRRARLHRGAARGLPDPGGQARRPAVGGTAPAHLVRARVPGRAVGPGPRRGHVAARHPGRAGGPARAAHRAGGPDRRHHRAPAVHRGDRRPGARARPGPDHRGRRARRPAGRRRRVRGAALELGRQPRLRAASRPPAAGRRGRGR
jgi:ABC-type multidrug transport system fused ATPase/permease subunit